MNQGDIDRFWNKVKKGPYGDCWEWIGCKNNTGGEFLVDGKRWQPSRFSYFLEFGKCPPKVFHTCSNSRCVWPKHFYTIETIKDALFFKTEKRDEDDCWDWTGTISSNGYGVVYFSRNGKRQHYAHRLSYELHKGTIPKEKLVCHRCDNRTCVNPKHLFLGEPQDNSNDMVQKGRQSKGLNKKNTKLSELDIIKIRNSSLSQKDLSILFNVSQTHISAILNRKYWKHI